MTHTPWTISLNGDTILNEHGAVAYVASQRVTRLLDPQWQNRHDFPTAEYARLIAAAPAMREALEHLVEVFNTWTEDDDPIDVLENFSESVRKAKAALAHVYKEACNRG